jgi:hypothetical protein
MAIDTTLRSTTAGTGTAVSTGVSAGVSNPARLVPARAAELADSDKDAKAAAAAAAPAPLRSNSSSASIGSGLQDQVARAQQALDYLERVAGQLENLKGQISAKLASGGGSRASGSLQQQRSQQLEASVRQLSAALAARKSSAGGGVDADLNFSGEPATQRFRIHGMDLDSLQQSAPLTLAFSIGGAGGPQMAAAITPDQSKEETARAIDRAVAPLGVRANVDNGALVFSTSEASWPAVQDSIAVSGRGRVTTEEVAPALAPQQWNGGGGSGGGNADALRQSLREVVQALERVRHSQDAASNALSSASVQVAAASTPPPEVEIAAEDFASAASNTNYDSLLALTSALVGVSRERVLALLGLR